MAKNAIGMGIAATTVLFCSNIVISLLRKVIPTGEDTFVHSGHSRLRLNRTEIVKAYAPDINTALGVFLPLIVVNCIILAGRDVCLQERRRRFGVDGSGWG